MGVKWKDMAATKALQAHVKCLESALDASRIGLDDWLNTWASELCDEARIKEAWDRIMQHGGTIAYTADLNECNRTLLKK